MQPEKHDNGQRYNIHLRFTPEEKEQAVIDYIEGNKSRSQICEELNISSRALQDWAGIYEKHGIKGLLRKRKNNSYSKGSQTLVSIYCYDAVGIFRQRNRVFIYGRVHRPLSGI